MQKQPIISRDTADTPIRASQEAGAPEGADFALSLLGPFQLTIRGVEVTGLSRAARAVLGLLAIRAGRVVERDHLATTLWPDSDEVAARYNLRRTLTEIRTALGPEADRIEAPTKHTLMLDLSRSAFCDVRRFDAAIRRTSDEGASREAVALYAARDGDLLEGERGEWLLPEREARVEAYHEARERLAARHRERGEWAEAIHHLRTLLVEDPTRETALRDLMSALRANGQTAAAIAAYQSLRERLRAESGSQPDIATTALYEQLRRVATESRETLALPAAAAPLPQPLTALIGRERDLLEITSHLHGDKGRLPTRLLTLTGAGGVGKTRMALAVAEQTRADFPDGSYFVDLATLTDTNRLDDAIANALGISETPSRSPHDLTVEFLCLRRALLILDNAEPFTARVAPLARTLLHECPNLTVLATSREPLQTPGEVAWRVPGLEVATARRLFIERAEQAYPAFALQAAQVATIDGIVERLDGIPLAIEMAAARVRALTVEQIAARLGDAFRLLTTPGGDLLPRHRTLRATLDWSFDLLAPPERSLLTRLSVFVGGWTLEAAEAVCAGDDIGEEEVLDRLASLVDKSLVVFDSADAGRYRLLETVRQYSREKCRESGEIEGLQRRHFAYYLGLAQESDRHQTGADAFSLLPLLDRDYPNLTAALDTCRQTADAHPADPQAADALGDLTRFLWHFWLRREYLNEGRAAFANAIAAIERCPPADREVKAITCNLAGTLAGAQGDYAAAEALYERSLALYREFGNRDAVALLLNNLGSVNQVMGRFSQAELLLTESLEICRESEKPRGMVMALNNLGNIAVQREDYSRAYALHSESLTLSRSLSDPDRVAFTLNNLGVIAMRLGEFDRARALQEESVAIHREMQFRSGISDGVHNLGCIAFAQGDYDAARAYFHESLTLEREIGNGSGMIASLQSIASLFTATRRFPIALQLWAVCEQKAGEPLSESELADHRQNREQAWEALGDEASAVWERGLLLTWEEATALALDALRPAG